MSRNDDCIRPLTPILRIADCYVVISWHSPHACAPRGHSAGEYTHIDFTNRYNITTLKDVPVIVPNPKARYLYAPYLEPLVSLLYLGLVFRVLAFFGLLCFNREKQNKRSIGQIVRGALRPKVERCADMVRVCLRMRRHSRRGERSSSFVQLPVVASDGRQLPIASGALEV